MAAITQEILITGTHFDSENKENCTKIGFFFFLNEFTPKIPYIHTSIDSSTEAYLPIRAKQL